MKYDFTIFGSGISAKIISSLLARNGFTVCLISGMDQNQKINTNLVTFLSAGSLNYGSNYTLRIEADGTGKENVDNESDQSK